METDTKIDEKIRKLLEQSLLISPKNKEEILKALHEKKKTKEQKEELLAILETEKTEIECHIKEAITNDPEETAVTIKKIETKGRKNLNEKRESIDRKKDEQETDNLLKEIEIQ